MKGFDIFDFDNSADMLLSESANTDDIGLGVEMPSNDVALAEAFLESELTSDEMVMLCESANEQGILINEAILSEKSVVRMDKAAKKKRLFIQSVIVVAREKGDRDFNKLLRVWKMRRFLLNRMMKRHASAAKQRADRLMRGLSSSGSKTVRKAVARRAA